MRRQLIVALMVFAFSLPLLAAVPLVDPQPIAVPAGLTAKEVSRGIRMGLTQRGWIINKENPQSTSIATTSTMAWAKTVRHGSSTKSTARGCKTP